MRGTKVKILRKAAIDMIKRQSVVPTNFSFKNFFRQLKRNYNRGTN